jgi:hypothetical protein
LEKKYDRQFKIVFDAIRQLMSPPEPKRREIGFHVKYDDDKPKAKKTLTARIHDRNPSILHSELCVPHWNGCGFRRRAGGDEEFNQP